MEYKAMLLVQSILPKISPKKWTFDSLCEIPSLNNNDSLG